jgi:murein DD-endopeptidase / murein LD-carboxypeptidase
VLVKSNIFLLIFIVVFLASCATHEKAVVVKSRTNEHIESAKTIKSKQIPTDDKGIKSRTEKPVFKSEKEYDKYLVEHYAEVLKTPKSYIKNNLELYKFIDMWTGTPYKYGGSTMYGIDCSGLAKTLFDEVYHLKITRDGNSQYKECDPIKKDDLIQGDLVFFKIGSRYITHVGVFLGNGKFFHASSKGVMISDLNEKYYQKYFFSGGRLKDK